MDDFLSHLSSNKHTKMGGKSGVSAPSPLPSINNGLYCTKGSKYCSVPYSSLKQCLSAVHPRDRRGSSFLSQHLLQHLPASHLLSCHPGPSPISHYDTVNPQFISKATLRLSAAHQFNAHEVKESRSAGQTGDD